MDEDRHLKCQEHLEPHIAELIDRVSEAGWTREETAAAIIALADNIMLGDRENTALTDILKRLP